MTMKRMLLVVLLLFGIVFAYQVLSTQGNILNGLTSGKNSINLNETLGPIVLSGASVIQLDRHVYSPEDTLILKITNNGNANLTTGYAFKLYRLENGRWKEVPLNLAFIEVAVVIEPGKSWEQRIDLSKLKLESGHYKIEKTVIVTAPVTKMSMGLVEEAEFDVRG